MWIKCAVTTANGVRVGANGAQNINTQSICAIDTSVIFNQNRKRTYLYKRASVAALFDVRFHRNACLGQKLMGNNEEQNVRVFCASREFRHCDDIWWKRYPRKVFDVFVASIDDFCDFLPINYFFKDPHAYLRKNPGDDKFQYYTDDMRGKTNFIYFQ